MPIHTCKIGDAGLLHPVVECPFLQTLVVGVPDVAAAVLYLVQFFELRPQKSGGDFCFILPGVTPLGVIGNKFFKEWVTDEIFVIRFVDDAIVE